MRPRTWVSSISTYGSTRHQAQGQGQPGQERWASADLQASSIVLSVFVAKDQ